jgi:hypothetical protein
MVTKLTAAMRTTAIMTTPPAAAGEERADQLERPGHQPRSRAPRRARGTAGGHDHGIADEGQLGGEVGALEHDPVGVRLPALRGGENAVRGQVLGVAGLASAAGAEPWGADRVAHGRVTTDRARRAVVHHAHMVRVRGPHPHPRPHRWGAVRPEATNAARTPPRPGPRRQRGDRLGLTSSRENRWPSHRRADDHRPGQHLAVYSDFSVAVDRSGSAKA